MGLDGVDTSGRRAKAEGHMDASALGWVGSLSVLKGYAWVRPPHDHSELHSFSIAGASQNLPLGESALGGTGLRRLCPTAKEVPTASRPNGVMPETHLAYLD